MQYVRWSLIGFVVLLVGGFLHYTLPQRDIVRIVGTYETFVDFGMNRIFYADSGGLDNKDVLFIQGVNANGRERVYRNEDTNFWPPYLKFDTANLQTAAADTVSTAADPVWVIVTHYGWRSTLFTAFPNAVSIRPATGPDQTLIPWFNIGFFVALAALLLWLRARWIRFREDRIDPVFDDIEDASDAARGRVRRAFDRLFGRRG